jgi:hypothetical protein
MASATGRITGYSDMWQTAESDTDPSAALVRLSRHFANVESHPLELSKHYGVYGE